MRDIKFIKVDLTNTPNTERLTAKDIHHQALKSGLRGIGHHFVIDKSGGVEIGRPITETAYCNGQENKVTVGILAVGTSLNQNQTEAIDKIIGEIRDEYPFVKVLNLI